MAMTKDEILKIGALARLEIKPGELDALAEHFNGVLKHFALLDEVDTDNVDPFALEDREPVRLREDTPVKNDKREAILDQSPAREGDFIRVPRIGGGN